MSMNREVVILIADDDAGHIRLIEKNLRRAALQNRIERFEDGQEVLDYLFGRSQATIETGTPYVLLLDIRMPKVDGVEVLRQIKEDPKLRKIPVIMLTTTDDPGEVERCHLLGCNNYIVKPVDHQRYAAAVNKLGQFITLVKVPDLSPNPRES
jgi:CheY-like chemotaxis protein